MHRNLVFVFCILAMASEFKAQEIKDIFRNIPLSYLPYLTSHSRDSLISNREYIFSGSDSTQMERYTLDIRNNDCLTLTFDYLDGPSGFFQIALRRFLRTDGKTIVVYSKYGGSHAVFDQHELMVLESSGKTFKVCKTIALPSTIASEEFIDKNIPAERKNKIKECLSSSYELNPEETSSVEYVAFYACLGEKETKPLVRILYTWNGTNFVKKIVAPE